MKPPALLAAYLEEFVLPHLFEKRFLFFPSRITFKRTVGYAQQQISFGLDKQNREDRCAFWTMWGVRAPIYKKWHIQQFAEPPVNDSLGGSAEWNIPGWSGQYAVVTPDREESIQVMRELVQNIDNCGLPYVDSISTWRGAAEAAEREPSLYGYGRVADFWFLAEEPERARSILLRALPQVAAYGPQRADELNRLKLRLKILFGMPD